MGKQHKLEPSIYWFKSDRNEGTLSVGDNTLGNVLETARLAGIPENQLGKIQIELDWGGCYYEGDTPSIKYTFPLSVFDKQPKIN